MLRTLDVGLHGLSNPTRSHHCIKNGLEEQEGWVHRMGMVDIWHVFRPFFENGKISFEWQDPQIILQSYIYLSEKLQMICEPSEMAARMTPPPPHGHGVYRFHEKLKEVCDFFLLHSKEIKNCCSKREALSTHSLSQSTLKSYVQDHECGGTAAAAFCIQCPLGLNLSHVLGKQNSILHASQTAIYFEWVPDVLRDARWLKRDRPASRKMCPISLDRNHKFKLSGPALIASAQCGHHLTLEIASFHGLFWVII